MCSHLSNFMPYSIPMNRALIISAIVLVAVIMGISAVAPSLATHSVTPLVKALDCASAQPRLVCVAIDRDENGICDSDARSLISITAAQRLNILEKSCGGK